DPGAGGPARGRTKETRETVRVSPLRRRRARLLLLRPANVPHRAGAGRLAKGVLVFWQALGQINAQMCTSIVEVVGADGAGKGGDGWFNLTHSVVSYAPPHHALLEEAITIDFVNAALGPGARVAVELTLQSAKALSGALIRAIEAAEIEESALLRYRR